MIDYNIYAKQKWDEPSYEFGASFASSMMVHKKGDYFAVSYYGLRIAELYSDRLELIVPPNGSWNGMTNRFNELTGLNVYTKLHKQANGLKEVEFSFWLRDKKLGSARANKRIVVRKNDQGITFEAINEEKVAIKDNVKYRAFNAELKKLRAVLTTQAKLGIYDAYTKGRYNFPGGTEAYDRLMWKAMNVKTGAYFYEPELSKRAYVLALQWIKTNDAALLPQIIILITHRHNCSGSGTDLVVRCIKNALIKVQQTYLRDHCVTISAPSNSLSLSNEHDQNSQLLPSAGLREVQVSREAEVC